MPYRSIFSRGVARSEADRRDVEAAPALTPIAGRSGSR